MRERTMVLINLVKYWCKRSYHKCKVKVLSKTTGMFSSKMRDSL